MSESSSRPYRMRKRLQDVEETRRRIVEATVELHGSVGPAHTTLSGIADRAGVQRSTVYRHFPDDEALFRACTGHWLADHPWPVPGGWTVETDPAARLDRALRELYGYYAANEAMIANSFRDIDVVPDFVAASLRSQITEMHQVLLAAWPTAWRDRELSVAVGHALDFRTWQSLTSRGLSAEEAATLMAAMVAGGAGVVRTASL